MKPDTILKELAAGYWQVEPGEIQCVAFGQGASGRIVCRLKHKEDTVIGVYWSLERPDNDSFIPSARSLAGIGVHVPEILQYVPLHSLQGELEGGLALISDCGDKDLLSCRNEPWENRKKYYTRAMAELRKLHLSPRHERIQPPFNEELYCWEQEYFGEYFLGTHLGLKDWESILFNEGTRGMARKLASLPRKMVHRDFQSQNIMICGEEVYLIDFQGMREGLPEYDIASLLYDPYVRLSGEERDELWDKWVDISEGEADREIFYLCACQRLMQALGAFANIAHNKGNNWYLEQIPPAIKDLSDLLVITELANKRGNRLVEVIKIKE